MVLIFPYSAQVWENKDQKKLRIWTLFTQWSCKNSSNQTNLFYIQANDQKNNCESSWKRLSERNNGLHNLTFSTSEEDYDRHQNGVDNAESRITGTCFHRKTLQESKETCDNFRKEDKTLNKVKHMSSFKGKRDISEKGLAMEQSNDDVHVIDKACRYIFPVSFLFLNIFYFLYSFMLYQAI